MQFVPEGIIKTKKCKESKLPIVNEQYEGGLMTEHAGTCVSGHCNMSILTGAAYIHDNTHLKIGFTLASQDRFRCTYCDTGPLEQRK